jgi:hypothetical protein
MSQYGFLLFLMTPGEPPRPRAARLHLDELPPRVLARRAATPRITP